MSSIFSFFCLDAKEPKDQDGKSSAKKLYFFSKNSRTWAIVWFLFYLSDFLALQTTEFFNKKNIVFLYACGFIGQSFVNFDFGWLRLRSATVLLSVPELVEGTFSLIIPVISTSSITVLYLLLLSVPEPVEGTENWCLSLSKAHFSILICIIFW